MSSEQIQGLIRTILAAAGGFIVAKGWVSAELWAWLVGGAATIGPAIWSWFSNRPGSLAAKAQALDGVNVQVAPTASPEIQSAVAAAKASG